MEKEGKLPHCTCFTQIRRGVGGGKGLERGHVGYCPDYAASASLHACQLHHLLWFTGS